MLWMTYIKKCIKPTQYSSSSITALPKPVNNVVILILIFKTICHIIPLQKRFLSILYIILYNYIREMVRMRSSVRFRLKAPKQGTRKSPFCFGAFNRNPASDFDLAMDARWLRQQTALRTQNQARLGARRSRRGAYDGKRAPQIRSSDDAWRRLSGRDKQTW